MAPRGPRAGGRPADDTSRPTPSEGAPCPRPVVVHTADESAAAGLTDQLTEAITDCETRHDDQGSTEFEDHGARNAGDAARSSTQVFTPHDPGGTVTQGVGVARSGSTVTYVLATGGAELSDFPAGTFDEPLGTALARIGG